MPRVLVVVIHGDARGIRQKRRSVRIGCCTAVLFVDGAEACTEDDVLILCATNRR